MICNTEYTANQPAHPLSIFIHFLFPIQRNMHIYVCLVFMNTHIQCTSILCTPFSKQIHTYSIYELAY